MWSIETLHRINSAPTLKAKSKKPFCIESEEEIDSYPPFPFPHLGYGCDKVKREKIESLFCDASGFGGWTEPALTPGQLKNRLKELVREHKKIWVAIEEVGQFQLHLAVWK